MILSCSLTIPPIHDPFYPLSCFGASLRVLEVKSWWTVAMGLCPLDVICPCLETLAIDCVDGVPDISAHASIRAIHLHWSASRADEKINWVPAYPPEFLLKKIVKNKSAWPQLTLIKDCSLHVPGLYTQRCHVLHLWHTTWVTPLKIAGIECVDIFNTPIHHVAELYDDHQISQL
jgi:hypothetical protein